MNSCDKSQWKGSKSRDEFKYWHKQALGKGYYGCDLDFVLIEFRPPGIVAFLDFKLLGDSISDTEIIAYNLLIENAPLYIIRGPDPKNGPFEVQLYISGRVESYGEQPSIILKTVRSCRDWNGIKKFEDDLRENYRNLKRGV